MARQICDGFTLVTQVSLKRLSLEQMTTLEFELDKRIRDPAAACRAGLTRAWQRGDELLPRLGITA
jgi:hypothetical protein